MRQLMRLLSVLFVVLALASPSAAQVQTGSILVRAVDEQTAVLPGVTVTIASPVLVVGQMTGTTDAGGVYRFPSLTSAWTISRRSTRACRRSSGSRRRASSS